MKTNELRPWIVTIMLSIVTFVAVLEVSKPSINIDGDNTLSMNIEELPVFPTAQKLGGDIRFDGFTASAYTFAENDDPIDIGLWHHLRMLDNGWEITEHTGYGYGAAIYASKGDEVAFFYLF